MYEWHLREINNRSNLGWNRNQLYSLIQQLMRQDPGYYLLYTSLRPDYNTRAVSYPYYIKSTKDRDNTEFFYIDYNIKRLRRRRGKNQI